MIRALLLLLFSGASFAGPYAGITYSHDNDMGFCSDVEYCDSVRLFAGYDLNITENTYLDAYVSYRDQLNGSPERKPKSASVTIIHRF